MNQSYEDIISDQAYNEGFDAASKKAQKKYNRLFDLSKQWMHIYETSFGAPDEDDKENAVYFELRKLLKMPE